MRGTSALDVAIQLRLWAVDERSFGQSIEYSGERPPGARDVLALERILPGAHLSETSMRMPDRCGPATRSLQSEALRAHPPQALGGGLRGQRLAKLDARAEGGAVIESLPSII